MGGGEERGRGKGGGEPNGRDGTKAGEKVKEGRSRGGKRGGWKGAGRAEMPKWAEAIGRERAANMRMKGNDMGCTQKQKRWFVFCTRQVLLFALLCDCFAVVIFICSSNYGVLLL